MTARMTMQSRKIAQRKGSKVDKIAGTSLPNSQNRVQMVRPRPRQHAWMIRPKDDWRTFVYKTTGRHRETGGQKIMSVKAAKPRYVDS